MNLLDTSEIPHFPESVVIGYSKVQFEIDEDILDKKELELMLSFTNRRRKAEFLTARHLFWFMISAIGWDENSIILKKDSLGKPFIKTSKGNDFVSFSHTRDYVLCAISEKYDIGIDAEDLNREVNPAILKRILSDSEKKNLVEEHPLVLWTMKEAIVKSLGTGLRTNLKEIELIKNEDSFFSVQLNQDKKLNGVHFEAFNHSISLTY